MSTPSEANAIRARMEARGRALAAAASEADPQQQSTFPAIPMHPAAHGAFVPSTVSSTAVQHLHVLPSTTSVATAAASPHHVTTVSTHFTPSIPQSVPAAATVAPPPSSSFTTMNQQHFVPVSGGYDTTTINNNNSINTSSYSTTADSGPHFLTPQPLSASQQQQRPAATAASLQSFERCKSLKERIAERASLVSTGTFPSGFVSSGSGSGGASAAPLLYRTHTIAGGGGSEPTRDVYAHALPFPPAAVLEVERVALGLRDTHHGYSDDVLSNNNTNNSRSIGAGSSRPLTSPRAPTACAPHSSSSGTVVPPSSSDHNYNYGDANSIIRRCFVGDVGSTAGVEVGGRGGHANDKSVLLMATECAAVVRDLQQQLEVEARRSVDLSTVLRKLESDLAKEQHMRAEAERAKHQIAERYAALEAVHTVEKRRWSDAVASERDMGITANNEAIDKVASEYRSIVERARSEAAGYKAKADQLMHDNARLEHVLRELKEQTGANVALATTSTSAVDKLTRELLLSKQQTNFISVGYKKQDAELRSLRDQSEKQAAELAHLRAIAAEHAILVAQRNEANIRLDAMQREAAEVPRLRAELTTLKESHAKLTIDYEEKASKAAELKEILDDIRKQANNAYVQTMGFNTMAEALSPGRGGGGGAMSADGLGLNFLGVNPSSSSVSIAQLQASEVERLRHEIEAEQRRAEEERRRWRERTETSIARN